MFSPPIDQGLIKLQSPKNFEPPVHILSRHEKQIEILDTGPKEVILELIKERQKIARQSECTKCFDEHIEMKRKVHQHCVLSGEEIYDPAAKLLVASVKWVHSVASFAQMKSTIQLVLLHTNWRELFILTAAQYSFYFDEG